MSGAILTPRPSRRPAARESNVRPQPDRRATRNPRSSVRRLVCRLEIVADNKSASPKTNGPGKQVHSMLPLVNLRKCPDFAR